MPTLLDRAEYERALAPLEGEPLAVAVADIDRFLEINEDLGHAAGDSVLRSFERTLTGSVPRRSPPASPATSTRSRYHARAPRARWS